MTENALPGEWTKKIDYLHVPTADFHAPDMEGIDSAVEFIQIQIQNQIVEKLESENKIVEGNIKLIEIYSKKIQDRNGRKQH